MGNFSDRDRRLLMDSSIQGDPNLAQALVPALRLVVVGTGRSGTTYTANLLQGAGIPIDHEAVFTECGPQPPGPLQADASWMAVPYLPRFTGAVLHQVREPLAVLDSLLDLGLFAQPFQDTIHLPWRHFLERHFTLGGDPLIDVMRFYVDWNRRCEAHAGLRVRVEDEAACIAPFVDALWPGTGAAVERALAGLPQRINSREERGVRRTRSAGLHADDLPRGPDRDALLAMAERYGYLLA